MITVASVAELASVWVAPLKDGTTAYVVDKGSAYTLVKGSGATADGTNIIQPFAGSPIAGNPLARWLVGEVLDRDRFLSQSTWHINALTGSDNNDGLTAQTALKTHAEFVRRITPGPMNVIATVFVDADTDEDFVIDYEVPTLFAPGTVLYQGIRTLLHAGSLTAVTNWDATVGVGGTEGTITDAGLPVSWTASGLVESFIVLTSGANAGAAAWIDADKGAKTARFSPFISASLFGTVDPAPGDTYECYSHTKINGAVIVRTEGGSGLGFLDLEITGTTSQLGPEITGFDCFRQESGISLPVYCKFSNAGAFVTMFDGLECNPECCLLKGELRALQSDTFLDCCLLKGGARATGGGFLDVNTRSIGAKYRSTSGGYARVEAVDPFTSVTGFYGVYDSANDGIVCERSGKIDMLGYGIGSVAGIGFRVDAYGAIFYDGSVPSLLNIATGGSNTEVGGTAKAYGALPYIEPANNAGIVNPVYV